MKSVATISLLALILMSSIVLITGVPPYLYDGLMADDFSLGDTSELNDRNLNDLDKILQGLNKRSCIRRGGICDNFPSSCCSGACRCNLWGTNCQCQRMGIFQKWG